MRPENSLGYPQVLSTLFFETGFFTGLDLVKLVRLAGQRLGFSKYFVQLCFGHKSLRYLKAIPEEKSLDSLGLKFKRSRG